MSNNLSTNQIFSITKAAFTPLLCEVTEEDRGREFRIRIFQTPDSEDILDRTYKSGKINTRKKLAICIGALRELLIDHNLTQWAFPEI